MWILLSGQPAPANVGFTASVGVYNLTNIGSMQTIVFDSIVSNAGYGYDRATGIFRAPTALVFFIIIIIVCIMFSVKAARIRSVTLLHKINHLMSLLFNEQRHVIKIV